MSLVAQINESQRLEHGFTVVAPLAPTKYVAILTNTDEENKDKFMVRYKACLWHPFYNKITENNVDYTVIKEFIEVLNIVNRLREELNKRSSDVHRDIVDGVDNQVYGITLSNVHYRDEESWWWVDMSDQSSWWLTFYEIELLYKYGWYVSFDKT